MTECTWSLLIPSHEDGIIANIKAINNNGDGIFLDEAIVNFCMYT